MLKKATATAIYGPGMNFLGATREVLGLVRKVRKAALPKSDCTAVQIETVCEMRDQQR